MKVEDDNDILVYPVTIFFMIGRLAKLIRFTNYCVVPLPQYMKFRRIPLSTFEERSRRMEFQSDTKSLLYRCWVQPTALLSLELHGQ
jgi:hypothetical protein